MDYKDNIVLIGMPGSGKTRVGRSLAALTAMTFLDLDDEIQRAAGKDIPRIFYEEGEEGFRLRETDCARKAAALRGFVIACGGGIILKEENMGGLSRAGTGDVVLLAGKGHETYQEVGEERLPLDEREVVADYFARRKGSWAGKFSLFLLSLRPAV